MIKIPTKFHPAKQKRLSWDGLLNSNVLIPGIEQLSEVYILWWDTKPLSLCCTHVQWWQLKYFTIYCGVLPFLAVATSKQPHLLCDFYWAMLAISQCQANVRQAKTKPWNRHNNVLLEMLPMIGNAAYGCQKHVLLLIQCKVMFSNHLLWMWIASLCLHTC